MKNPSDGLGANRRGLLGPLGLALLTWTCWACGGVAGEPIQPGSTPDSSADGTGSSSGGGQGHDAGPGNTGSSGSGSSSGGGASDGATTTAPDGAANDAAGDATTPPTAPAKQALIWLWQGYSNALSGLASNPTSFTHVSPTFYDLDYNYQSGAAEYQGGNDNFEGMTSTEVVQKVHAMGMKIVPAVQAGAGNQGTDQGIQNLLNDSPAGAQHSFIASMTSEAMSKGYDGYNMDFEPGNMAYADYGTKYLSFLSAFKSALNAQTMQLSIDIGSWYMLQCAASNGTGLVDLAHLGASVDLAIVMDYTGTFGGSPGTCPAQNPMQQDCDSNFVVCVGVMCNLPPAKVSIGMISGNGQGANSYLPQALQAVSMYGFGAVAVWPSGGNLSSSGVPQGGSWYTDFAQFLGH
jgi:hypothetical protein